MINLYESDKSTREMKLAKISIWVILFLGLCNNGYGQNIETPIEINKETTIIKLPIDKFEGFKGGGVILKTLIDENLNVTRFAIIRLNVQGKKSINYVNHKAIANINSKNQDSFEYTYPTDVEDLHRIIDQQICRIEFKRNIKYSADFPELLNIIVQFKII